MTVRNSRAYIRIIAWACCQSVVSCTVLPTHSCPNAPTNPRFPPGNRCTCRISAAAAAHERADGYDIGCGGGAMEPVHSGPGQRADAVCRVGDHPVGRDRGASLCLRKEPG